MLGNRWKHQVFRCEQASINDCMQQHEEVKNKAWFICSRPSHTEVFLLAFFSRPCNYTYCGDVCWSFFCLFFCWLLTDRASLLPLSSLKWSVLLVFGVKILVVPAKWFQTCLLQITMWGLAGCHCALISKAQKFWLLFSVLTCYICFSISNNL